MMPCYQEDSVVTGNSCYQVFLALHTLSTKRPDAGPFPRAAHAAVLQQLAVPERLHPLSPATVELHEGCCEDAGRLLGALHHVHVLDREELPGKNFARQG